MKFNLLISILLIAAFVSCKDEAANNQTPKAADKIASIKPKTVYQSSVDFNKITKVYDITDRDKRWTASLVKNLKFTGKVYFAQRTNCPVIHKDKKVNGAVFFIRELNRYVILFDRQRLCFDKNKKVFGILTSGTMYRIPKSNTICFLTDTGDKPMPGLAVNDEKTGNKNLPNPKIQGSRIQWSNDFKSE